MVGRHRLRHVSGDLGWSRRLRPADARTRWRPVRPGDLCRPEHVVNAGSGSEHDGATDGTLLPNPNGGAVNRVEPYPLTYVEYAIVPTQPLLNSDCTADTATQTSLNEWLTFLVNQGQNDLPVGMAPLPSTLAAQANADIAKVGAAAPACTPPAAPAAPSSNTTSASAGSPSLVLVCALTPSAATPYAFGSSVSPGHPSGSTPSQTSGAKTAGSRRRLRPERRP